LRYIIIYLCRIIKHSIPVGQEMKSKKEENEIFPVAPNPSKGWMVYSETEWVSLDDDSSNKDRDFGSAFPWKP